MVHSQPSCTYIENFVETAGWKPCVCAKTTAVWYYFKTDLNKLFYSLQMN